MSEWLWKGSVDSARVTAAVIEATTGGVRSHRHRLAFGEDGQSLRVIDERRPDEVLGLDLASPRRDRFSI